MPKKVSGTIVVTMLLLSLAGCDPEALIKSKVPEPVQSALTLGGSPSKSKIQLNPSVIEIVSPKKGAVYATNEETTFEVRLKPPGEKPLENPEVSWTLFPEGKNQVQLGGGPKVKRKLDPGKYRAEATLTVKDQKVSQSITFREGLMLTGKVVTTEGVPLPGVDLELWDSNEQVVSKVQSANDGKFAVEFPSEGPFRLTASRKEYSFLPLEMAVRYAPDTKLEFIGNKAEISEIVVTESEESTTPVLHLCPNQEIFLKLKIKSDSKPRKIEAQLLHQEKEGERAHSFENLGDGGEPNPEIQKLRVPTFFGPSAPHYRLRVTVVDEKGNKFSANSRELYKIDMFECFRTKMAEAINVQRKGDLGAAAKRYTQIEEYYRIVGDPAPFTAMMEKVHFNRGISDLSTALALDRGDSRRSALLSKAVQDFNAALKIRKADVDALFFRGLISHLSKSYEAAVQDYSEVFQSDPQFPGLLKLRGMAYVGTGIKKNLLLAIFDFSDALKSDPSNRTLRKSRAETLKTYAGSLKQKDDSSVDISQIQLPNVQEGLDLNKIRR
ncbi:MAG: hypothetical protein HY912_04195 [Desulfomonile tiedjei]|uniref:Tetratricopeptide repeat protein n=1 Tax=Desulfomonile tiedjei TaxID=2358 RepID=A0A9D6V0W1_9BACT|nr:hypothetical protein [Desulfomonile tiedjei]